MGAVDEGWLREMELRYPPPASGTSGSGAAGLSQRCGVSLDTIEEYSRNATSPDATAHAVFKGMCVTHLLRPALSDGMPPCPSPLGVGSRQPRGFPGSADTPADAAAAQQPGPPEEEKKKKKKKKKKKAGADAKDKEKLAPKDATGDAESETGEGASGPDGPQPAVSSAASPVRSPAAAGGLIDQATQENLTRLCGCIISSLTEVKTRRSKHRGTQTTAQAYKHTLSLLRQAVILSSCDDVTSRDALQTVSALKVSVKELLQDVWVLFRSGQAHHPLHPNLLGAHREALEVKREISVIAAVSASTSGLLGGCSLSLSQALIEAVRSADLATTLVIRETVAAQADFIKQTSLADTSRSAWNSYSAYFMNKGPTHGVSFTALHVKRFISLCSSPLMVHELIGRVVMSTVAAYADVMPSQARSVQLCADAFHFAREIRSLRQHYCEDAVDPISGGWSIEASLCDLLFIGLLLTEPIPEVVRGIQGLMEHRGAGGSGGGGGASPALPAELWMPPPYLHRPSGAFNALEVYSVAMAPQPITHEELMKCGLQLQMLAPRISFSAASLVELLRKRWELWDVMPQIPEEDKPAVADLRVLVTCVELGDMSRFATMRETMGEASAAPPAAIPRRTEEAPSPAPPSPADEGVPEGEGGEEAPSPPALPIDAPDAPPEA